MKTLEIEYRKRFDWIKKIFNPYLHLLIECGLECTFPPDLSNINDLKTIQRKLLSIQRQKLKNKSNIRSSVNGQIQWLSFIYSLERQMWSNANNILQIGNPIFIFYMIEICSTIFINKDPKKTILSHKKIRNDLLPKKIGEIGWKNLIFPLSIRRTYKKWNMGKQYSKFLNNDFFKIINSSCYGSKGKKFKSIFEHWKTKPSDTKDSKKKKYREKKMDFYIYFYDLFYHYSESLRYRPIIPNIRTFKEIEIFNYSTLWIFSLILTFWEVIFYVLYKDEFQQIIEKNLKYSRYYKDFQNDRWRAFLIL